MCMKYRTFKNTKIQYVLDETFSIICDKCGSKCEKKLKKKNELR